jgi:hypothetical protein
MAKTRGTSVAGQAKARDASGGATKERKRTRKGKQTKKEDYPPNPPHRPRNPKPTH